MKLPALGAHAATHRREGHGRFLSRRAGRADRRRSRVRRRARVGRRSRGASGAAACGRCRCGMRGASLFNFPPPTQGLASLMILALFDRLGVREAEGFAHVHGLVEATKQAFIVRDRIVGDPGIMRVDPQCFLEPTRCSTRSPHTSIRKRALPWPQPAQRRRYRLARRHRRQRPGGELHPEHLFRVRLGLRAAENSGFVWQNRGASFALDGEGPRVRRPGASRSIRSIPAMARFDDGRVMVYGTMGGEGQPQTQGGVFSRYGMFGAGPAGGDHRAALAARQDLGRGQRHAETRKPLRAGRRRGACARPVTTSRCCPTSRARWATPARSCAIRTDARRRDRPAQRRRGNGVLRGPGASLPFAFAH